MGFFFFRVAPFLNCLIFSKTLAEMSPSHWENLCPGHSQWEPLKRRRLTLLQVFIWGAQARILVYQVYFSNVLSLCSSFDSSSCPWLALCQVESHWASKSLWASHAISSSDLSAGFANESWTKRLHISKINLSVDHHACSYLWWLQDKWLKQCQSL